MGQYSKAFQMMKEDAAKEEAAKKDKKHKLDYENPYLRAKIGELENDIEVLKRDMKELTEAYYTVLKRYG
jgi:TATA-binding protein-associated factor Taf7